jgi:hypothetical protein
MQPITRVSAAAEFGAVTCACSLGRQAKKLSTERVIFP